MATFAFLSHSNMPLYLFRSPIMKRLKDMGHHVIAIGPDHGYNKILDDFEFIPFNLTASPTKLSANIEDLRKLFQKLNIDLLQTSAHHANVVGSLASKNTSIKYKINLVEGLGSFYVDNYPKTLLGRYFIEFLYRQSLKVTDGVIFVNNHDANYFRKFIADNKIKVIKSIGVDEEYFSPDLNLLKPKEYANCQGKKIVLMIARAIEHKGVLEFYKASELLDSEYAFFFMGDVDNHNKSKISTEFLSSTKVNWIGFKQDIRPYLKYADLFVLPSFYKEGFPQTILEAMSMQKTIVTTNSTGCNEAIQNNHNGMLCIPRSAENLAYKIAKALYDPKVAKQLASQARQDVLNHYRKSEILNQYIDYYRQFMDL